MNFFVNLILCSILGLFVLSDAAKCVYYGSPGST
ncbi:unnamed protein product, partial [Allacma fusca]